jgi:hypothetical protein
MTEKTWTKQVPDLINLALGIWLFLAPWIFGFAAELVASVVAWGSGAVVAIVAIAALATFAAWEEWVNAAVGVGAAVSPWLLGFSSNAVALRVHLIAGIAIAALAALRLWLQQRPRRRVTV